MSENKYIACIDVGTTGCRAIIFTAQGAIVSQAYEEYSSIFLSPTWIDHDPTTWIRATNNTLKQAIVQFPGNPSDIVAICVISQRSTFIPVDRAGTPLDNAILWQDKRATSQAVAIKEKLGAEFVYTKTGLRIDPYFSLPKLLWLMENKPELIKKTHKILSVHGLVMHYLTGQMVTDWTQASRTMLFNISKFEWDAELCESFGIPMELLPSAVSPGSIAGTLKKDLQTEFNIRADIPVISVGGDAQAAAVGLGVVQAGLMCVNTGTGSFILSHAERPAFDKQQRVICTSSAVAGKWLIEASIFTSGSVYRWFRDNFATVENETARELQIDSYDILNSEMKYTKPGAQGVVVLPHFAGSAAPYWDPAAAGLIFGLSLGHKRADVIRAILEGLCFEICKNIRIIESHTTAIREVRVSGGATRSITFNQMQADIYGKAILRGVSEQSSALGAMIVAATSIGLYPDVADAVDKVIAFDVHNKRVPDDRPHVIYEKMLEMHDALYKALASHGIYEKAHELRQLIQNQ